MTLEELIRNSSLRSADDPTAVNFGSGAMNRTMDSAYNNRARPESNRALEGDLSLTVPQLEAARGLADRIIDHARTHNIRLESLTDLQAAMGFDQNSRALSRDELASYLVGASLQSNSIVASSMMETSTIIRSGDGFTLGATEHNYETNTNTQRPVDPAIIAALGKEVFGDTFPAQSAADTSGSGLPENVISNLNHETRRC